MVLLVRSLLLALLIAAPVTAQPPEQGPPPRRVLLLGDPLPAGAVTRFTRQPAGVREVRTSVLTAARFTPDGRWVAMAVGPPNELIVWETATGNVLRRAPWDEGADLDLGPVTPDGRQVFIKRADNTWQTFDLRTGKRTPGPRSTVGAYEIFQDDERPEGYGGKWAAETHFDTLANPCVDIDLEKRWLDIWDVRRRELVRRYRFPFPVNDPDGWLPDESAVRLNAYTGGTHLKRLGYEIY